MFSYIGSGDYCYANASSMLLAAHGENIPASLIEVLCGVGLGAIWNNASQTIYFSNLATLPDRGITHAFDILGFQCDENWSYSPELSLFEALKQVLLNAPALLGPIDAGFLRYDPQHIYSKGIDHYVLALYVKEQDIFLHDPSGFQYVALSLEDFLQAWKAEAIHYRRGSYSYWTKPVRYQMVTDEQLFNRAIEYFKAGYYTSEFIAKHEPWARDVSVGSHAIIQFAEYLKNNPIAEHLKIHLTYFMFKLSSRRALDFALFFKPYAPLLAKTKNRQAELFGLCHSLIIRENWRKLIEILMELAAVEEEFRFLLLKLE